MTGYYDPYYEEKFEAEIDWLKRVEKIKDAVMRRITNGECIKFKSGAKKLQKAVKKVVASDLITITDGCMKFHGISQKKAEEVAWEIADQVKWHELKYDEKTGEFEDGPGDPSSEWIGW
jgi:hypothetical protein